MSHTEGGANDDARGAEANPQQVEATSHHVPVIRAADQRVLAADSYAVFAYNSRLDLAVLSMNPLIARQDLNEVSDGRVQFAGVSTSIQYTDVAHVRMDTEIALQVSVALIGNIIANKLLGRDEVDVQLDILKNALSSYD